MKRNDTSQLFTRVIRWSAEDDCYVGSLPEIAPNCCHGDSIADVAAQLDDIAEIALANCESCGIPYDPPGSARIRTQSHPARGTIPAKALLSQEASQ